MVATMTRKQRRQMESTDIKQEKNQDLAKQETPKARQKFTPQNCSVCLTLRDDPETSYSFVYHTAGNLRYCKCGKCGNTWKEKS